MLLEETAGEGWWDKETTCDYRGGRAVSVCVSVYEREKEEENSLVLQKQQGESRFEKKTVQK